MNDLFVAYGYMMLAIFVGVIAVVVGLIINDWLEDRRR